MTTDKQSFRDWLTDVDRLVQSKVELSIYDLPDMTYRAWYEDEFTPDEAAGEVVESLAYDWRYIA